MMHCEINGTACLNVFSRPGLVLLHGVRISREEFDALISLLETARAIAGPGPWETDPPYDPRCPGMLGGVCTSESRDGVCRGCGRRM